MSKTQKNRELAIKMYYGGISGQGVGKILSIFLSLISFYSSFGHSHSKRPVSQIMFNCLPDPLAISSVFEN